MRFTLDSNVLVYALDRSDDRRHSMAVALVERATRCDCVLLLQCLAECFNVTVNKLRMPASESRSVLTRWRNVFPVQAASPRSFEDAMDAVLTARTSFWDAMLWATAREAGCGAILSEDFQDGRTLGGVRFVDPFNPANAAALDRLFA